MNETPIIRHWLLGLVAFVATGLFLTGCNKREVGNGTPPAGSQAFDPDREPDAILAEKLSKSLGPVRKPGKSYRFGAVVKHLGNHYWQLLAHGMSSKAVEMGVALDIQSAVKEADPQGQLEAMQAMVARGYDAILISPQTSLNLMPAILEARRKGIVLVVVADSIPADAEHFVGPRQYEAGVSAARFFMERFPAGGDVALIRGRPIAYSVPQRSQGFIDTLKDTKFNLVADEYALWDLEKSIEIGTAVLAHHPKLAGFYCNNDIMALGVVQAVKNAGAADTIVVGTAGIGPAMDSIRAGELSATIDLFPDLNGKVAVEVALRLLAGQKIPRVVYTPQALVTRKSLASVPAK